MKALLNEKVGVYLIEEEGDEMIDLQTMRCRHFQPMAEDAAVLRRCGQPIVLGKTACLHHELHGTFVDKPLLPNGDQLPLLQSARDAHGVIHYGHVVDENTVRVFKIQR